MESKHKAGKIYQVVDQAYIATYYCSTIQELSVRMAGHRLKYKTYEEARDQVHYSLYDLFDRYGTGNCKIELVELFACKTRSELHGRDGHYITTISV